MAIPESLLKQSELTPTQIEALSRYLGVKTGHMKWKEAAAAQTRKRRQASNRPVSLGSYYRTVQQAKNNVRKSAITLLIAVWLGLVRVEDMRRLFDLASRSLADLSDEDKDRLGTVVEALLTQMTQ